MKKTLFGLMLAGGLFLSWACNSPAPSSPNGSGTRGPEAPTVTFTPTNQGGFTSTPTATLQPTPPFISEWGVNGPNGLAEGNGYIYVAEATDSGVSQVQLFAVPGGGTAAATWTGYGSSNFLFPDGVAVNTGGDVYVLDGGVCADANCDTTSGSAVYEFGSSATPTAITKWSGYGATPFNNPSGMALDSSGDVYVADTGNFAVEEFGSGGATMGAWTNSGNQNFYPGAVALDTSNNIYVVDPGNSVVWKLASITGTTTSWPLAYASDQNDPYYGLTVDSSGNVYVGDYANSLVEVYTNSGSLIGLMNGETTGATPFTGPDLLLLYNGNIYVGDYDNDNVQIFGPNNY